MAFNSVVLGVVVLASWAAALVDEGQVLDYPTNDIDARVDGRSWFNVSDPSQYDVTLGGVFGGLGYFVILALVIAILVIVAEDYTRRPQAAGKYDSVDQQYSQGYYDADQTYTAFRALEDVPQKYAQARR